MGFINALPSPRALTAKVMTGEFIWAVAEGKTIICQMRAIFSHSMNWLPKHGGMAGGSPLFNLDV